MKPAYEIEMDELCYPSAKPEGQGFRMRDLETGELVTLHGVCSASLEVTPESFTVLTLKIVKVRTPKAVQP